MTEISLREAVETFLYRECALLDRWQLREWRALFAADGEYLIATPGLANPETASPLEVLFLVADDQERLSQRVERLLDRTAHVEYPHSKTRHFMTNVLIESDEGNALTVTANVLVYRTKGDDTTTFPAHLIYRLVREGASFRIREKRCVIDTDSLAHQGKMSIIL